MLKKVHRAYFSLCCRVNSACVLMLSVLLSFIIHMIFHHPGTLLLLALRWISSRRTSSLTNSLTARPKFESSCFLFSFRDQVSTLVTTGFRFRVQVSFFLGSGSGSGSVGLPGAIWSPMTWPQRFFWIFYKHNLFNALQTFSDILKTDFFW